MTASLPKHSRLNKGQTLLGLLLAMAVFAILANAIFTLTTLSFRLVSYSRAKIAAQHLAQERLELIRNLAYEEIGTQGGIPPGDLLQTEEVTLSGLKYTIETRIVYIDDPFDNTAPSDTLPTDYKRVRVSISWEGLAASRNNPVTLVSDIAPSGIETTSGGGTLSILVFDSNAQPISQASVHIQADSLDPVVNLNLATNENGRVILPGTPVCTECYLVTVTKDSYSEERTYSISEVANPNKPYLSVIEGQVTEASFAIDQLSTINLASVSDRESDFSPLADITFQLRGQKTLGTDSNDFPVYKFDKEFTTDLGGKIIITDVEWDNYEVIISPAENLDITGTNPLIPFSVLPNTEVDLSFALTNTTTHRLLAVFTDNSQTPIASASATLSFGTYEETKTTGAENDPDFGQVFFSDLQEKNHSLDATASGYLDHSSKIQVSDYTLEKIILYPE